MTASQRIRRSAVQWSEILQQFTDSASTPVKPSADWLPIDLTDSADELERTWEIELELPSGVQLRMRAAGWCSRAQRAHLATQKPVDMRCCFDGRRHCPDPALAASQ